MLPGIIGLRPFQQRFAQEVAQNVCIRSVQELTVFLNPHASGTTHGVAHEPCLPSSSVSTLGSRSQSVRTKSSFSAQGKRRCGKEDEIGEEDDEDDLNKRPRLLRESSLQAVNIYIPYFACPLFKNCAPKHQRRACRQPPHTFRAVHRVK